MNTYSRSHLSDDALLGDLATRVATERGATADLLASIAEVDERRLYAPAGHPSMFSYCVGALGLSEGGAFRRIQAARAARRFPRIFPAVAEGRLHLTAVNLLAPYLTEATAEELLAAAERKSKAEIERLLAERFPRTETMAWLAPAEHALAHVGASDGLDPDAGASSATTGTAPQPTLAQVAEPHYRARVAPVSAKRYELQFTIGQATYDILQYARALASHQVPAGDIAEVFDRALRAHVRELERAKFAATDRPRRRAGRSPSDPRSIPAEVKRQVWERDGGQCAFVSAAGQRCPACKLLEFDHLEPVARGGQATAANLRLLCRAHNRHEAERAFGAEFMCEKRERAQRSAWVRARAGRVAKAGGGPIAAVPSHVEELVPWLRGLGFRADEARAAAALCHDMQDATLERRVRIALSYFSRKRPTQVPPGVARAAATVG